MMSSAVSSAMLFRQEVKLDQCNAGIVSTRVEDHGGNYIRLRDTSTIVVAPDGKVLWPERLGGR